jgi:hypothetical protein
MKLKSVLFASLLAILPGNLIAQENTPPQKFDPNPYGWERYSNLTSRSPFDFDRPPPVVDEPETPMKGWALSGITKSRESISVTIVEQKTGQRVRLQKLTDPVANERHQKVMKNRKLDFVLHDVEFPPGEAPSRLNAKAYVSMGDAAPGVVSYSDDVDRLRPMAAKPMSFGGRGGVVQPGAAPQSGLAAMQQQLAAQQQAALFQANGGGVNPPSMPGAAPNGSQIGQPAQPGQIGQPPAGQAQLSANFGNVPTPPGVPNAAPNATTQSQEQLRRLLDANRGGNTSQQQQPPRRRVVLPSP